MRSAIAMLYLNKLKMTFEAISIANFRELGLPYAFMHLDLGCHLVHRVNQVGEAVQIIVVQKFSKSVKRFKRYGKDIYLGQVPPSCFRPPFFSSVGYAEDV